MRWGADPDALERGAAEFSALGRRLDELAARGTAGLRAAAWTGPDAERFRAQWSGRHRPALAAIADRCVTSARGLRRHADEQRRASAARGARGAHPTAPPPLPRLVDVYSATLEGGAGPVAGALAGTLTVEHLGGDRLRVSHTERAGGGAGLGAGRSAAVVRDGTPLVTTGASAGGALRLEGTTTRTWTVDEEALPALLAALALGASPLGRAGRTLEGLARTADGAAGALGVDLPLERVRMPDGLPEPERVEHLAGVALAGSATGGPRRVAASVAGTSTLSVGTATGAAGQRWVAQWTDTSSGTMTTALARALGLDDTVPADATLSVRIDLPGGPDPGPGREGGLVSITAIRDTDQIEVRAALDAAATAGIRDALGTAVDAAGRGDTAGATAALAGLTRVEGRVVVDVTSATLSESRLAAPIAAGAVTVTPTAGHVRITRR